MKVKRSRKIGIWCIVFAILLAGCGQANVSNISASTVIEATAEIPETAENIPSEDPAEEPVEDAEVDAEADDERNQDSLEYRAQAAMETLEVWDGSIAESFEDGDGSIDSPYQIANGAQLAKLASDANAGTDFDGKYFILTSDILLNDISEWNFDLTPQENNATVNFANLWSPIGMWNNDKFSGNFDGQSHVVWGMNIDYSSNSTYSNRGYGLFGILCEGSISNVTVACSNIQADSSIGVILGKSQKGTVLNCHALEFVIECTKESTVYIGGICGEINNWDTGGGIYSCSSKGVINCSCGSDIVRLGGIVGDSTSYAHSGTVSDCYSACEISFSFDENFDNLQRPSFSIGGICGWSATITNSYSICKINVDTKGLTNELLDSDSEINVYIGGVTGMGRGSIINSGSAGTLEYSGNLDTNYVGGISGMLYAGEDDSIDVTFSYSNAIIKTDGWAGGITGGSDLGYESINMGEISITNCYYNGGNQEKAVGTNLTKSVFTNQVKGLSENELKDSANYKDWNFIWDWTQDDSINDGFPIPMTVSAY